MKSILRSFLNKLGYEINRSNTFSGSYEPWLEIDLQSGRIVDLEALARISTTIPGMITPQAGQLLYAMCYMQQIEGDVVEIGSWQGRSTSFLARAVENSNNGRLFAIDHFKGNVGAEHFYIIGQNDLSDLEGNFVLNMQRLGLDHAVQLLNMPSKLAEEQLADIKIRFLFIDGDHTKKGVETDIMLFLPKLVPGSIIVFDDFSEDAPGLIQAVDSLMIKQTFSRAMSYTNTLVLVV